HVRAHERAVRVVMFEERNEARRHGDELLWRDIHVMDFRRFHFQKVAAITDRDLLLGKMSLRVHGRVRLRDEEILLTIAGQIIDLVGDTTLLDFAVRRFDETEFVDPREGAHRADETDVRTFRSFDRTNAAVMRWMHVADFEARAIAAQSAWPEGREPALVRQLRERIRLIHELRQL